MPVERGQAQRGQTVTLRAVFKLGGTLFNPSAISQVQIIDPDESTVLETITGAAIVHDGIGRYHVDWAIPDTADLDTHFDRWFWTSTVGAVEKQGTLHFLVLAATVGGTLGAYMSVDELKTYLPADTDLTDAQIVTQGALAQETIETICGRLFLPLEEARIFDGTGESIQPLDRHIQAVSEVEFRDCDGTWQTMGFTDVRITKSRKMLSLGNTLTPRQRMNLGSARSYSSLCSGVSSGGILCGAFPSGVQNVRITGTWGFYTEVPLQIQDAMGRLVQYAGSCDDDTGSMSNPFLTESVPGGRAYTLRTILRNARVDQMTGYADVDAILKRFSLSFSTLAVQ
jgi:hypothetical protein